MTTAFLHDLIIVSADTTKATDEFLADQAKINRGVKRDIKAALQKAGLSGQFCFAAQRVSNTARSAQIYATESAAAVIANVKNVDSVKPLHSSMYPPTRKI